MNDHLSDMDDERMQESLRIAELISKWLQNELTVPEQDELEEWKTKSEKNKQLFDELTDEKNIEKAMQWFRELDTKRALQKVKAKIGIKEKKIFPLRSFLLAASMIGIIAITALVFFRLNKDNFSSELSKAVKASDVAPGGNKATLQFADGTIISLNGKENGLLRNEKGTEVFKSAEGELAYHSTDSVNTVTEFNVLSTPAGGQYAVQLPDGTKAWLNASSSLKYPVSFSSNERRVEASGEVYFEVKKEKAVFVVESGDRSIKVLGTHFNVSAYPDENFTTVLLEGSIRIRSGNDSATLKPGQQAMVNRKINVSAPEHPDDAIAWKNGFFQFTRTGIRDIMKQLARWYDIEVVYEAAFSNASFTATVSRNENVSIILKRLEKAGGIHFTIEGKLVTVKP